jgi:DNA-binding CsgD family transcriptional regulator/tetratricopeptide (TPR) repeat protein
MGLDGELGRTLVGRDIERAAAQGGLRRGGGVLLAGAAGVGKTALARALLEEIEGRPDHDVQWLVATAAGPSIPFGAFAPLVPDVGGNTGGDHDAFDLLQSLRRAVITRAEGKQLVLMVDDGHRLDEASATLVFQLVSTGHAAAVVTVRSGASMPDGMRALWKEGLVERIDLQPLGRDHTVQLAGQLLGGQLDGDLGEALWQTSEGNPLYLRELVWAGRTAGRVVSERGLWRLLGQLTVGPRLMELVQERLTRVNRSEMATLEVVAFADPVPLSVLTRLAPTSYVTSLQRQGLLTVQLAQGEEHVRCAHPVYGEAIRAALPSTRVLDLRTDLAAAFESAGRLGTDLLRIVTWRLDAGCDEDPDLLLAASHRAAERQDWKLSGRLAEAALTASKETAAAFALADALNHQGRHEEALAALGSWEGDGDEEMARVAVLRAYILYWGLGRLDAADETLAQAEARIGDPSNRTWVAAIRAGMLTFRGRPTLAAAHIRPLLDDDRLSPKAVVAGRTALALGLAWSGRALEAVEVAESCLEPRLLAADDAPVSVRWNVLARLSAYRMAGCLAEMEALASSEYEQALQLHNAQAQGVTAGALGWAALARGRLLSAISHFRESIAVLDGADWTGVRSQHLTGLTETLALAGDPDGAAAALLEAGYDDRPTTRWAWPRVAISSAWVSASRGELSRAVEQFLAAASSARANGQVAFEVLALHSAARLGEVQVADRLVEMATWVQGPLIQAAAAQAAAMAAGSGPGLDKAAAAWDQLTMWLHAAECSALASRAHTLAGSPRRAAASAGRAEAFLEHCDGPRPIGLTVTLAAPTLTRREREVALLAQTGLSSQTIAERLYLSVRTVDSHLARTYTKLGITSRRELGAALASLLPRQADSAN